MSTTMTEMTPQIATEANAVLADAVAAVADRAAALDAGSTDTREDIAALGAAGLLAHGITDDSLPAMIEVLEQVSTVSLAAAFSAWAQRMAAEYVHRAPEPLRSRYLDALVDGRRVGVTAMAAGLKQVAGLGDVPIVAQHDGRGFIVNGPIHWASNVVDDALIVLPVREKSGITHVAVLDASAPGVTINPEPTLIGLGSTASTSLRLENVRIDDADVISNDLAGFVRGIRPTFLLAQTAFCVGAGDAALTAAEGCLGGIHALMAADVEAVRAEHRSARDRLYDYAAAPQEQSPADFIRLRLEAAQTAVAASRLEATLRGGAGYVTGSPTNRRFREIAFLPIQSPSEGQLRWELAQYE